MCLRLLPGDGARTSQRSSFDPRNKEGWEGRRERGETGRVRETDGCRVGERRAGREEEE